MSDAPRVAAVGAEDNQLSLRERSLRAKAAELDAAEPANDATAASSSSRASAAANKRREAQREAAEVAMGVVRQIVATPAGAEATHDAIRNGKGAHTIVGPLVRLLLRCKPARQPHMNASSACVADVWWLTPPPLALPHSICPLACAQLVSHHGRLDMHA